MSVSFLTTYHASSFREASNPQPNSTVDADVTTEPFVVGLSTRGGRDPRPSSVPLVASASRLLPRDPAKFLPLPFVPLLLPRAVPRPLGNTKMRRLELRGPSRSEARAAGEPPNTIPLPSDPLKDFAGVTRRGTVAALSVLRCYIGEFFAMRADSFGEKKEDKNGNLKPTRLVVLGVARGVVAAGFAMPGVVGGANVISSPGGVPGDFGVAWRLPFPKGEVILLRNFNGGTGCTELRAPFGGSTPLGTWGEPPAR